MASRLDITQNYLSLLENNRAEPSVSLLKRISMTFHVPISFLFLEASVDFESAEPEVDGILKELRGLVHQLERARIRESQESADGPAR